MSTFFAAMPDGSEVRKIELKNELISAGVITYGGTLTSLKVLDRNGSPAEILLGYDNLEGYLKQDKFLCALVGRYANRIGNASFCLNEKEYQLEKNDGENHLHGGSSAYHTKVWKVLEENGNSVTLGLTSPDMDGGYPGRLDITVTYTLEGSSLKIDYEAVSDADTLCNLTSHGYFNLSGDPGHSVENDFVKIYADRYTPTDEHSIPTGDIADVAGTPLDLREMTRIGLHIDDDFDQLNFAGGYDHNFVINGQPGTLRPAAEAYCEASGIHMLFETDQPGMQFYTGNYLETAFKKRSAFCFESQAFPDSPNKPNFPICVLRKNEKYTHRSVFSFDIR